MESKRKPGRPLGSKNAPKATPFTARAPFDKTRPIKDSTGPTRTVDPMRVVDDQLRILAWTQELLIKELEATRGSTCPPLLLDIKRLSDLSNAIARCVDSMKRVTDIAEEIAARKTSAELLEMAMKKIEGQDMATLNYAIRRLRAFRDQFGSALSVADDKATASDVIAALEDE